MIPDKNEPIETGLSHLSDPELVSQMAVNALAFAELVNRHGPRVVHRLQVQFDEDDDMIEECASVGFMKSHATADLFDERRGSFRNWVHRISFNVTIDELRRREREGAPLPPDVPQSPTVSAGTLQKKLERDVAWALTKLPPRQRQVISADLAADGKVDAAKLAAELGITADAVRQARCKGKQNLLKLLSERGHSYLLEG